MASTTANSKEIQATPSVAREDYYWTLEAFERQGNLWLRWDGNTTFRPADGQLRVYTSQRFPEHPNQDNETQAKTYDTQKEWNTGLLWGAEWYCAYIAQSRPDTTSGPDYAYVVQVVTD